MRRIKSCPANICMMVNNKKDNYNLKKNFLDKSKKIKNIIVGVSDNIFTETKNNFPDNFNNDIPYSIIIDIINNFIINKINKKNIQNLIISLIIKLIINSSYHQIIIILKQINMH